VRAANSHGLTRCPGTKTVASCESGRESDLRSHDSHLATRNCVRRNLARRRSLNDAWEDLCSRYLPVSPEGSIWRSSRPFAPGEPQQGWKIHVSATVLSATRVLSAVGPLLRDAGVVFKAPRTLGELRRINSGLHYGFSQVGKVITVYTRTPGEARSLARDLHRLTRGMPAPAVPYDVAFGQGSCTYYRYGSFHSLKTVLPDGTQVPAVRDPAGRLVPDLREPGAAIPPWSEDPIRRPGARPPDGRGAPSPLKTTYRAFEALSQRGKGGVYCAADLSVTPARLCVLKEGRRHGETDWYGRDGRWRVRHERCVLDALAGSGVGAPEVYAAFDVQCHSYLVTEFIHGQTLGEILEGRGRRLRLSQALRYASDLARLLCDVHAAGWAWRDCKPSNVIVSRGGRLRPVDFEGACRLDRPDPSRWGTTGYVPPRSPGRRAGSAGAEADDLYALGATLHYLLTGRIPGEAPPPPVSALRRGVPAAVREVVAALTDPGPSSRPSARAALEAIEAARGGVGRDCPPYPV
jgi:serine/threonine protein kinase